jgi:Protein of unknown function, DUF547
MLSMQKRYHIIMILVLMTVVGCATIRPTEIPVVMDKKPEVFVHDKFESVLERFVDSSGRVAYTELQNAPHELELYYRSIAAYSPDSHPELFPTDSDKLAYWVNAYNAAVMKTVITYYPLDSVLDVKPPAILFFMPNKAGFFIFQKPIFGGHKSSLYHLENGVIRKRFSDPRIHFALNCASIGCPRLPREAFSAQHLDRQLDRETRLFLAEERNFKIDYENEAIVLSEIFDWYEKDFSGWLKRHHPHENPTLLSYIARYLSPDKAKELEKVKAKFPVRFKPYDWGLNDRK